MLDASSVLIVVDVQNSFLPGGSLAVPRGDEIVPLINGLARKGLAMLLTPNQTGGIDGALIASVD